MSDYIFGWLPFRAFLAVVFFTLSLVLLFTFERGRKTGRLDFWIAGLSLWAVGLFLEVFSREEAGGWGWVRLFERIIQLVGGAVVLYAVVDADRRMRKRMLPERGA